MTSVLRPAVRGSDGLRQMASVLDAADGAVAFVADDLVIAEAALAPLVSDPFVGTALLVRPAANGGDVRVRHHVVMSVGSPLHDVAAPDHRFVGAMVVSSADASAAASVLRDAAAVVDGDAEAVQLAAVALVRSGISCKAVGLVDVPWFRDPQDREEAQRIVDAVPSERIAQLQANRVDDGFFSTFVIRRLSKPVTRLALRMGWSPNAITLTSFAIGLAAAAAFALGYRWALVIGAVLLQASIVVDCVDGEVARATRRFSTLGAWLDASTDRVKEYVAYAGLAIGASAVADVDLWPLAIAMMVLQTVRHMTDYDFSRVQRAREARVTPRSFAERSDGADELRGGWSVAGAMEASSRINRRSAVRWAKRALHMPIGERWLVISLGAALFGAAWALIGLFVLGLIALAYVIVGRTLRTLTWRGLTPPDAATMLARQADAGPLLTLLAPRSLSGELSAISGSKTADNSPLNGGLWARRWAWALPAGLRLVELGLVGAIALILFPSAQVLAFWWIAVLAFHHYDVLYRAIQGHATPRWLTWGGLGWDGRTVLVLLATAGGVAWFSGLMAVGIAVWSLLLIVIASIQWLRSMS